MSEVESNFLRMLNRILGWTIPILLLLIGFLFLRVGLADFAGAQASLNWPNVKGVITTSFIETATESDDDGETKRPQIEYAYSVDGVSYTGARVRFGQRSGSDNTAEGLLALFPEDKAVDVFYDPEAPEQSVLKGGGDGLLMLPVLGVILTLLGFAFLFVIPRRFSKQQDQNKTT